MLGGVGGIAMVGVLAVIAVQACQDYSVRAKISVGLNAAAPVKVEVAEYYATSGEFPNAGDAADMSILDNTGDSVSSISVEADTGHIVIEYADGAIPGGGYLELVPVVTGAGSIDWTCGGTIANKHLPAACRSEGSDNTM